MCTGKATGLTQVLLEAKNKAKRDKAGVQYLRVAITFVFTGLPSCTTNMLKRSRCSVTSETSAGKISYCARK